ncbi:putative minor capsid protein [Heyndrickxia ginsengihumi]|uniref:putative minor capsid protein n=1 Tax=Heyndrickxia ginsengihumi TaxID=363870 RepID=UPI003D1A809B
MLIKPIPKLLLPHSVEYYEYLGKGRTDDEFAEKVILEYVRVDLNEFVKKTNANQESLITGTLFIDAKNTSPRIIPKEKSKIVFDGKTMFLENIEPLVAFNKIHHWEIDLT